MDAIKMILTDLDDTLLTDDKQISPRNREVFAACKEAGILTGFATARSEIPTVPYAELLKPEIQVLNSGGLVLVNGKTIGRTLLSKQVTAELLAQIRELAGVIDICVETAEAYYCNQKDIFKFGTDYSHARFCDFREPFQKEAYKITIHTKDKEAVFAVAGQFEECHSFAYATPGWCCIQPKGVSKGNGAKLAADYLGIPLSSVAAFGDDVTDIELLRNVGVGVAMENAIAEVAKTAAYHTLSNQADGVACFIETHILQQKQ